MRITRQWLEASQEDGQAQRIYQTLSKDAELCVLPTYTTWERRGQKGPQLCDCRFNRRWEL